MSGKVVTMQPPEMVTITNSNRVKLKLTGTAPAEAYWALNRYLDMVSPVMAANRLGVTLDMVTIYETASLVLDIYDHQVLPQMRGDEAPEVLKLSLSRMEALRLWWLAQCDPAPVDVQMQWLTALNQFHQKL